MQYPKISIVTPSFNQGQYIEQTILSVLNQDYPNLEYIVIDGGSTDNTVEVLKKYKDRLTYWISEPDSGQSEAINKGLRRCTGDIFNWLCSDDYLEPGALHAVAALFLASRPDIVAGRARLLFPDQPPAFSITTVQDNLEEMIYKAHICQPSTFFRMKVVQQLGPLNPKLHYMMDAEWWLKYLLVSGKEKIKQTDAVLANYRYHGNSKSVKEINRFLGDKAELDYGVAKALRLPAVVHQSMPNEKKSVIAAWIRPFAVHRGIDRTKLSLYYINQLLSDLKRDVRNKETFRYVVLYGLYAEPDSRVKRTHILLKRYVLSKLYKFYKSTLKTFVRSGD